MEEASRAYTLRHYIGVVACTEECYTITSQQVCCSIETREGEVLTFRIVFSGKNSNVNVLQYRVLLLYQNV